MSHPLLPHASTCLVMPRHASTCLAMPYHASSCLNLPHHAIFLTSLLCLTTPAHRRYASPCLSPYLTVPHPYLHRYGMYMYGRSPYIPAIQQATQPAAIFPKSHPASYTVLFVPLLHSTTVSKAMNYQADITMLSLNYAQHRPTSGQSYQCITPHMVPLAYDIPHPSAPLSPDAYQCTMSPSLCTYMLYVPYILSVKQAPQPTTIILASASHTSSRCHSPHRTHATLSFTQHLPKPHPHCYHPRSTPEPHTR